MRRFERVPALAALAVCLGLCPDGLRAQEAARPAVSPSAATPEWGTKDQILTRIGFAEFDADETPYAGGFEGVRYATSPHGFFEASVHVPSGALLTSLELDYCDTAANADHVSLFLEECSYLAAGCNFLTTISSANGAQGCSSVSTDLTGLNYTMNNRTRELFLVAITESGSTTNELLGAYVGYKLQISPAPATATFADVPTSHPYFRAVEALAASGITGGCGNGNFCPNQNVTRGEMAVFLARALGLYFPN